MATLTVEIRGTDLPGRSCDSAPGGEPYENIHVGVKHRTGILELVPGDAPSVQWECEVTVRPADDGGFDFGGPFVLGRGDDRHLGLAWVTVAGDGSTTLFRGAKLKFVHVDPALIERALGGAGHLVASIGLSDRQGFPICATVKPPDIAWSVGR
jgi:hypothetical protein